MSDQDWVTPRDAWRMATEAMGEVDVSSEARDAVAGWISSDRVRLRARNIDRWLDRYCSDNVVPPPMPVDHNQETDVEFRWSEVPEGQQDSSGFWSLAELKIRPRWQSSPNARVIYTGIRIHRPDICAALELAGLSPPAITPSVAATLPEQAPEIVCRAKPGPNPFHGWEEVVREVTADCINAGYKRPLARGEKTAISTALLEKMAEKYDEHFSPDSGRNYAELVIRALPDS